MISSLYVRTLGQFVEMYTNVAIVRHWPKWLPGSEFRHETAVTRQQLNQLREEPYKGVLSNIVRSLCLFVMGQESIHRVSFVSCDIGVVRYALLTLQPVDIVSGFAHRVRS